VTAQAIHDLVTAGAMTGAAARFGLDRFAPAAGPRHQEERHAAQRQR
jgi:hypothetical protein